MFKTEGNKGKKFIYFIIILQIIFHRNVKKYNYSILDSIIALNALKISISSLKMRNRITSGYTKELDKRYLDTGTFFNKNIYSFVIPIPVILKIILSI